MDKFLITLLISLICVVGLILWEGYRVGKKEEALHRILIVSVIVSLALVINTILEVIDKHNLQ